MKFKVGDRVYFYSNTYRKSGIGKIFDIDGEDYYIKTKDKNYLIEPKRGETLISSKVYNSPLYKALKEDE